MAEEAKDPGHDVPRAVNLVLIAVLGVYMGISVVALSALPVVPRIARRTTRPRSARTTRTSPCSASSATCGLHGAVLTVAQYYVGVLAATILFIATNAGLIGISRLSWSLAEHRQLPSIFSRLHPTLPHAVVHDRLLLGVRRAADPAGPDQRARQPLLVRGDAVVHDRPRRRSSRCASRTPTASAPTGCPGTSASAGEQIPITAVIGGIGTFAAWMRGRRAAPRGAHDRHPLDGRSGWPATSTTASARVSSLARAIASRAPERPPDFHELGYRTALVPIFGEDVSASDAVSAAKLIGEDGVVYAIFVLPVPQPALARCGPSGGGGARAARSSRAPGSRRVAPGIKVHTGLIRTRNPGAALVEEAERVGCRRDLLVDLHAPAGEQRIGPTAAYLLDQAPLPRDHRDGEPPRAREQARSRARAGLRPAARSPGRLRPLTRRHAPARESARYWLQTQHEPQSFDAPAQALAPARQGGG